jgi:hypothetical protein
MILKQNFNYKFKKKKERSALPVVKKVSLWLQRNDFYIFKHLIWPIKQRFCYLRNHEACKLVTSKIAYEFNKFLAY